MRRQSGSQSDSQQAQDEHTLDTTTAIDRSQYSLYSEWTKQTQR